MEGEGLREKQTDRLTDRARACECASTFACARAHALAQRLCTCGTVEVCITLQSDRLKGVSVYHTHSGLREEPGKGEHHGSCSTDKGQHTHSQPFRVTLPHLSTVQLQF